MDFTQLTPDAVKKKHERGALIAIERDLLRLPDGHINEWKRTKEECLVHVRALIYLIEAPRPIAGGVLQGRLL